MDEYLFSPNIHLKLYTVLTSKKSLFFTFVCLSFCSGTNLWNGKTDSDETHWKIADDIMSNLSLKYVFFGLASPHGVNRGCYWKQPSGSASQQYIRLKPLFISNCEHWNKVIIFFFILTLTSNYEAWERAVILPYFSFWKL